LQHGIPDAYELLSWQEPMAVKAPSWPLHGFQVRAWPNKPINFGEKDPAWIPLQAQTISRRLGDLNAVFPRGRLARSDRQNENDRFAAGFQYG
jgi:hypothetical protein